MTAPNITLERLQEILHYCPETGLFTRRTRTNASKPIGGVTGCIANNRYVVINVGNKVYLAHRLAWFYMTGAWPEDQIDHINGIRHDNRWENLREATRSLNCQNQRKATRTNKLGVLGVCKVKNRYLAQIRVGRRNINLGSFSSPEEAHAAYLEAKRKLHDGCTI